MRKLNIGHEDSNENVRHLRSKYNSLTVFPSVKTDTLLKRMFGSIGKNCVIEPPIDYDNGFNIHIGNNFHAGAGLLLLDTVPVYFGNNVHIASNVHIHCGNFPKKTDDCQKQQPIHIGDNVTIGGNLLLMSGVKIGDNCIFGSGTIIVYPNVKIGRNCTISSGSVVTKDVPDNALVMGKVGITIKG